jgi:hypothetical protein
LYLWRSLGFGYQYSSYSGSTWEFYPQINEQFRHYYNLEKSCKRKSYQIIQVDLAMTLYFFLNL